jgi:hypothetical protein
VDANWSRASIGGFAGSQPDPQDFGFSNETREYGAYVQLHNRPSARGIWSLTSGAVGSYVGGEIDREFLYLQSMFVNPWLSIYAVQELDHNRGWKSVSGEQSTTPTSTFASARVSLGSVFALHGGFDNRRNVRLYRDHMSPETEFDDSFRRGVWGGAWASLGQHVRVSADARGTKGGTSGWADSYTGSVSVSRITPAQVGLRVRSTRYTGNVLEGRLQSATLEATPFSALHVELGGGHRQDVRAMSVGSAEQLRWLEGSVDLGLGRSWYFLLSAYRETGAAGAILHSYGSLSWRF